MSTDNKSTNLVSRLREFRGGWKITKEAANEIERLREALIDLESMYARTWDRVGGGLVMMPDSVPRFEAAHKKAREALGITLIELDEQPDDEEALRRG